MIDELIQFDKNLNGALKSNPCVTISKQDAYGLNNRNNFKYNEKEAMQRAHGNMLITGIGIIGGTILIRKYPIIGSFLLVSGLIALIIVISDWHVGKKYVSNIGCI